MPIPSDIVLLQKAASFAVKCHQNQLRRDGVTPYIAHPFRVVLILQHLFHCDDPVVLAAGLLHDAIEDTPTDYDEVAEHTNHEVAQLVSSLSKDMRGPRAALDELYEKRLMDASWQARLIKMADIYDNLCDSIASGLPVDVGQKVARALGLAGGEEELRLAAQCFRDLGGGTLVE